MKLIGVSRFFMVDRKREGNELREEFSVLGSTGNVCAWQSRRRASEFMCA